MTRKRSKSTAEDKIEYGTTILPPLATFVIVFGVYMSTVSPSIAGGDSGELLAEGCQLGTPHPPGYPLYMIITYVVKSIGGFFGSRSVALYMNMISCLFGAIACALVTSSVLIITTKSCSYQHNHRRELAVEDTTTYRLCACSAMTMGFLCAFSPLMWQYSVTSEVFALNNFFVALVVHLTLTIASNGGTGWIDFGAFVCGLALTNQVRCKRALHSNTPYFLLQIIFKLSCSISLEQ